MDIATIIIISSIVGIIRMINQLFYEADF